jgi:UPF0755 protein
LRWRGIIAGVGLVLALAVAGGVLVVQRALSPAAVEAPEVIFTVAPGEPLAIIAARLEAEGLVRSARAVEWLARWRGQAGSLQVGEYRLSAALAPGEILERIALGRIVTYEVALPEGFTLEQIAERLAAAGLVDREAFLAMAITPEAARQLGVEGETLEGYLFPETYRLPRGLPSLEVARVLVDEFHAVWREIAEAAAEQGFSMKEVVTLASIVEKETGVPEERRLIASVFLRRLERGMRIESDPTVIYGIPDFDGNLRRRDLENPDNPYNTYRIPGLPPGPIASPGADSLRAVVNPAESDYLFFVSKNDGTHFFSSTYREHVNAVNRYQRRRSPRRDPQRAAQATSEASAPSP